ncbi:TPA: hypothetical protein JBI05_01100 [Legionella pneumophila]|nr:hypothetical protein [Legionella pneumophila]
MSFLKRIFGTVLNDQYGGYRNSHHGQKNNYPSNKEFQGIRCPQCQISNALGACFCSQCGKSL